MDFWTRLIGGGGGLTSSRGLRKNAAGERLTRFKHICNALHHLGRSSASFAPDSPATAQLRSCLARLNLLLSDEARGPAPHPCHAFAATSQVYRTVTHLALASFDADVLSASAQLFNTLIEAEVDGLIDDRAFARCVVDLVRRAAYAGDDGEARLVELVFGVANNIRLRPAILPAWFTPQDAPDDGTGGTGDATACEFAGATRKDDFPLFYLLIDYVHREGRPGDFARTGVLYIIETAARSRDLERWLIESDLATLMATGLGAQYSQLSRTLVSTVDPAAVPYIVALSDHARLPTVIQPDSEEHLNGFLTYLLFWQDAIDYCKSAEVNDTLLDHFQILFLEQLLYPSLLESSDVDGGSTAAVTMYLCRILESIDQPALVHRILHFLMASPFGDEAHAHMQSLDKDSRMYASRRKSLDLLALFAEAAPKPSPTLFNLVDLVLMSLKSRNGSTVVATLRLIAVIIQRHAAFATSLIKPVQPPPPPSPPSPPPPPPPPTTTTTTTAAAPQKRTIGEFNAELQHLMAMATSVIDDPSLDQSYESYLAHASHVVRPPIPSEETDNTPATLDPKDGILTAMMDLLSRFYSNSVMINLALTNTLTALASSDLISLDGWLLVHPHDYQYPSSPDEDADPPPSGESERPQDQQQGQDEQDEQKQEERQDQRQELQRDPAKGTTLTPYEQPQWPPPADRTPLVSAVLQKLIRQLDAWRREITDFDILLAARRDLLISEGRDPLNDELAARLAPRQAQPGRSGASTPTTARNASASASTPASILDRLSPRNPVRSKSGSASASAATSGEPSVSRPQSQQRKEQVVRELNRRLVVNLDEGASVSDSAAMPTPPAPEHDDGEAGRADDAAETPEAATTEPRPQSSSSAHPPEGGDAGPPADTDHDAGDNADTNGTEADTGVTLGHILTNAVILYEFILEITAIVQVRATVLDEVRYTR